MLLTPTPVSSKMFNYNAAAQVFTADASDLGRGFNLGQVYDDACDVGFTIISAKTGKPAVFVETETHYDANDDDVAVWEFNCVTPGLKNLKAMIYND